MRSMKKIGALFVVSIAAALLITMAQRTGVAAEGPTARVLVWRVEIPFEPTQAMFIVDSEVAHQRLRASFHRLQQAGSSDGGVWLVAAALPSALELSSSRTLLFVDGGMQRTIIEDDDPRVHARATENDDPQHLEHQIAKEKEVAANLRVQMAAQEGALNRLRSDADVIGDLGRVAKVQREVTDLENALVGATRDVSSLQAALLALRNQPEPASFARRELELTQQLADLAKVTRQAEAGELARRNAGEAQLANHLTLLEESRYDTPETLRAQLVKLRKRRQELEEILESAPSTGNYE